MTFETNSPSFPSFFLSSSFLFYPGRFGSSRAGGLRKKKKKKKKEKRKKKK